MENSKNNKGVIALLIVIIVILSALCVLFATGTISFKSNDVDNNKTNQNVTDNNNVETNDDENIVNNNQDNNENNINLDNIKYDYNDNILGKYVNKNNQEDYFILYSDGKADMSYPSGDRGTYVKKEKINYGITYNESIVILNFYELTEPESPIKIGILTDSGYMFAHTTTTAANGALMFDYVKINT